MSTQTEDLEAKAREAIDRIREIAGTRIASDLPMTDPAITEIRALSGRVQHFFTMRSRSLAQPKEVAPTVEKIMEVVEDCVDMQDGDGSSCVVAVLDFDKFRADLTKLLTNP